MFFRFLIFSGSAALVNFLTGQLLYGFFSLNDGFEYAFSVSAAFLSGMIVSYILNRKFTFPPSGKDMRDEISMFFLVSIGGLLLTTGLAHGLYVGAPDFLALISSLGPTPIGAETLAHLIAIGVTAFYSFFAHRDLSFRRAKALENVSTVGNASSEDVGDN